jgi:hypothetical protein
MTTESPEMRIAVCTAFSAYNGAPPPSMTYLTFSICPSFACSELNCRWRNAIPVLTRGRSVRRTDRDGHKMPGRAMLAALR